MAQTSAAESVSQAGPSSVALASTPPRTPKVHRQPLHPTPPAGGSRNPTPELAGAGGPSPVEADPRSDHAVAPRPDPVAPDRALFTASPAIGKLAAGGAALVGVVLTLFIQLEPTCVGQATVLEAGGPRLVQNQISGPVSSLLVRVGDRVVEGQPIARLDLAALQARQQRLQLRLSELEAEDDRVSADQLTRQQAGTSALKQKRALLWKRLELAKQVHQQLEEKATSSELVAQGAALASSALLSAQESEMRAHEQLLLIRQQLADTDLALNDRQKLYHDERQQRVTRIDEARAALDDASQAHAAATIRSPIEGRIDSLMITPGQVLPVATPVAYITAPGQVNTLAVFLSAADAALFSVGRRARLELISPNTELDVEAQVARISAADQDKHQDAPSVPNSVNSADEKPVRVELRLLTGPDLQTPAAALHVGQQLTVRLHAGKRRVYLRILDFVKGWLPGNP